MDTIGALLGLGIGYLFGSVPFGVILTQLFGAGDLRSIGSGNIGATNVLRTGRKGLAAATLLLDMAKGLVVVLLAQGGLGGDIAFTGLGAILGHCFPVWLRFRGGKGVATLMGVSLGFAWPIGAAYAAAWISILVLSRISSLAGMIAAVIAPIAAWLLGFEMFVPVLAVLAVLVVLLHRANVSRLLAGTEPRIGFPK